MDVSAGALWPLESGGSVVRCGDGPVGDGLVGDGRVIVAGAVVDCVASVVDAHPPANSSASAQPTPRVIRRTSVPFRVDESIDTTLRTDVQSPTLVW